MNGILPILQRVPVIPVAVIPRDLDPVNMASALLAGGIPVMEVTLRTPEGLPAIRRIHKEMEQMCVGAGTAWTAREAEEAIAAGAEFVVSPGRSDAVHAACLAHGVPYLPGVQTVSEAAYWMGQGLEAVKFFPASVAGGPAALKAFSSVLPGLSFCPTGGVSAANAPEYLALPSVPCVGGGWLFEKDAMAEGHWGRIQTLAATASRLGRL